MALRPRITGVGENPYILKRKLAHFLTTEPRTVHEPKNTRSSPSFSFLLFFSFFSFFLSFLSFLLISTELVLSRWRIPYPIYLTPGIAMLCVTCTNPPLKPFLMHNHTLTFGLQLPNVFMHVTMWHEPSCHVSICGSSICLEIREISTVSEFNEIRQFN